MWSLRLTDSQRDALRLLIQAQGEIGPSLTGALEALDLARWDDLPDAALPWDDVVRIAASQGVSEADEMTLDTRSSKTMRVRKKQSTES